MEKDERYKIEVIAEDGRPILPVTHATVFISQCGVVVRDNIPITIQDWNKAKADGRRSSTSFVDDRAKDNLWKTLMANFMLPRQNEEDDAHSLEGDENIKDPIEEKVKEWTLKKMAEQFINWKKRLNKDYVQKGLTPEFTGAYVKLKDHWDEFVEYKKSEEAKKTSAINKKNAAKKEYHHSMGSGGYRATPPMRMSPTPPQDASWPRLPRYHLPHLLRL